MTPAQHAPVAPRPRPRPPAGAARRALRRRAPLPVTVLLVAALLLAPVVVALLVMTAQGAFAAPAGRAAAPARAWAPPLQAAVGVTVVRRFTAPAHRWSPGHRGVDLAAAVGSPVLAPATGVVTVAGRVVDRDLVVLRGPGGLRSTLEPVTPGVRVGDVVHQGQQVGVLAPAPAHCGPTPCLHWGVRRGDLYLDPLLLLRPAGPPVLMPMGPRVPGRGSAVLGELRAHRDDGLGVHLADA